MGVNMANMAKMLKCANADDVVTMKVGEREEEEKRGRNEKKTSHTHTTAPPPPHHSTQAEDGGDTVTFMFESPSADRVSDFELRLMDIDSEQLGIPDTEYAATVKLPSSEFARIVRDLASIGDTVVISVTKDGVKFSTTGDAGSANVTLKQHSAADAKDEATTVECSEPVTLSFALRYLNSFAKAAPLSPSVTLSMSKELPIVVSFQLEQLGQVSYFLAPKLAGDEDMDGPE